MVATIQQIIGKINPKLYAENGKELLKKYGFADNIPAEEVTNPNIKLFIMDSMKAKWEENPDLIPVAKTEEEKPKVEETKVDEYAGMMTERSVKKLLKGSALLTKQRLALEPKVVMNTPLGIGEKPGTYDSVCINGYRCEIQKGVSVALPQSIADMLANKYNIQLGNGTIKVDVDNRIDGDANKMKNL